MLLPSKVLDQLPNLKGANVHGPLELVKSTSFAVGATAAGATTNVAVVTQDDNLVRTVLGIWVSGQTAGCYAQLLSAGRLFFSWDASGFSATHGPVEAFVPFAESVGIGYALVNNSAGVFAAHYVSLLYAVFDPKFAL